MENTRTDFYVYCHQRKDNGKCFYIGKGTGNRYESENHRNRHWHFVVDKYGFTPVILVNNLTEEQAWELEASFVEQIGVENLTNCEVPKAWGGCARSEETKAKLSEAMTGRKYSAEHRANISEAMTGRTWKVIGRIGVPRSEEAKAKIGNANRRPKPEDFAKKLSEIKTGTICLKARKPILQYDLQGNFIQEWSDQKAAAKGINKLSPANIGKVCCGKQKSAYGFIWKFKN